MAKKRVYEIAKDEGLPSNLVLQRLQRAGMVIKTASSTVDLDWAMHLLNPNRYPQPDTPLEAESVKPAKAVAEPAPAPVAEEAGPPKATRPRPRPRPRVQTDAPTPEPTPTSAVSEAPPVAQEAPTPAPTFAPEAATAPEPAMPAEPAVTEAPAASPTVEVVAAPEPPAAVAAEAPAETAAVEPVEVASPAPQTPVADAEPAAAASVVPAVEVPAASAPATTDTTPVPAAKAPSSGNAPAPAAETPASTSNAPSPAREQSRDKGPQRQPAGRDGQQGNASRPNDNRAPQRGDSASQSRPGGGGGSQSRPGGGGGSQSRPGGGGRPGQPTGDTRDGGGGGGNRRGRPRRVVIDAQANRRGSAAAPGGRGPGRGGPRPGESDDLVDVPSVIDLTPVDVASGATVKDLGEALSISSAQIIKLMMGAGELVTLTQSLSDDAIELIAEELQRVVNIVHAEDENEIADTFDDAPEDLISRAPVVTVMGHVDHGKTSLLDAVRKTEVAAGEAGGITQHIGAYQVHHDSRLVTFLDTPGHEAFTAMRARGAKITDVAVIVVAADDGVMPQTIEAIDHARAADVPFVVAVNKIDKENANPDRVRQELSTREVIPSDWGGSHEFVNVSALTGEGLNDLLETVLLVADADAEPKANPNAQASGTVIESRLDTGRGPVCTVLVQRGTLRIGDVILAGEQYGRVRAMTNYGGVTMTEATPSMPAEVLGLSGVPDAGDKFRIVDNERTARQMAGERSQRLRAEELANRRAPVSLDDLFSRIKEGGLKELNLIVKGDVQGSVGALVDALEKVEQTEVRLRIIHTGVGAITESDVNLAAASQAIIIGFNVRPRPEAKLLSDREGVDIRTYRVIYRAIEDVRDALVGLLEPDIVEDVTGQAEVRTIFRASRLGTIAGCYITEGTIKRGSQARLLRDGTVVHEGKIGSIRRFNEDVREVLQSFECGILLDDYNDVKEGDVIEAFELREVARTAQVAADTTE